MPAKIVKFNQGGTYRPDQSGGTALQNAASVASLLLTTEAMVAEKPEEKKALPPALHPEDL